MKDKKHLYWVVGLVLITIILSGTVIWINYNSWTIRFEMDDNTFEAIKSLNVSEIISQEENKGDYSFNVFCNIEGVNYTYVENPKDAREFWDWKIKYDFDENCEMLK